MKAKYAKGLHFPGWLFLIGMSVYVELLLHFWVSDRIVPGRLAAVLTFALAFGASLGFLASLLPAKGEKWVTVILATLMAVLGLVEYFIHDAFQCFMPLISIITTGQDVATGYTNTVVSLVLRNLWRIGLVLLPIGLFTVSKGTRRSWKRSLVLFLAALILYGGGIGLVHWVDLDTAQLSSAANYDGTVKSFGLSMGTLMDLSGGAAVGQTDVQFEIPQQTAPPASTEAATEAPQEGTVPDETTMPTEPPVVYNPHAFDLDFAALAAGEENKDIASLHTYLASLSPDKENELTGLFAGKNLILITAEAFSHKVVDPERTPALSRMMTEGIHFTDYYHPLWGCGTTGGEFANLMSLIPTGGTSVMMEVVQQDMFLTMGRQLQNLGYSSSSFHNNDHTYYSRHQTHEKLGYDQFLAWGNGLEKQVKDRSDEEMIVATVEKFQDQQPFSLYYMTLSGHSPYNFGNSIAKKYAADVQDMEASDPIKAYLACNMSLEYAMQRIIARLEELGIADDTVIVISADHYPYGLSPSDTWGGRGYIQELLGTTDWNEDNIRDRNGLIIWSGCLEDMDLVIDEPVSALDILPTLSNLFGLEYDSRLMVGRDVFSDSEAIAFWPLTYSWKTAKGYYNGSNGVFTPAEGMEVSQEYIDAVTAMVKNKCVFSRAVQQYDYYSIISALLHPENAG